MSNIRALLKRLEDQRQEQGKTIVLRIIDDSTGETLQEIVLGNPK